VEFYLNSRLRFHGAVINLAQGHVCLCLLRWAYNAAIYANRMRVPSKRPVTKLVFLC
jgi:hypothetical protein